MPLHDGPSGRQRPPRYRVRRFIWVLSSLGLLLVLWLGSSLWFARTAQRHLKAAQTLLQQSSSSASSLRAACTEGQAAGAAVRTLRTLLLPASPLIRRLGWVPRYGPALAAVPALTDVGATGADVADIACAAFAPAFSVLDLPGEQRLGAAVQLLTATPPDWPRLQAAFAQLEQAWRSVPASAVQRGPLAGYSAQAQRLGTLLPSTRASLDLVAALWPAAPGLLGLDQPITLLVAGQNPLELRPSGGFIGSIGSLTIANGKPQQLDYRNSGELNMPAPAGSAFPQPYADYLRGSQWFLRDANWWPNWERSARTLETFWELNGGAPVDGVVAVDLYALREILGAFGSLDVPGYGVITDTTSLEAIYNFYEPQGSATQTNKAFLGALFAACLKRVQAATASELPGIGAALKAALVSKHISVYLHDPQAQQTFVDNQWDGALRETTGDYVQVVDADLSYSDVQPFIDQQLGLSVQLNQRGVALTNTLTITYTNRYDDWQAEATKHQVYGYCYSVQQRQQQRIAGCYGDYVRVYLPPNAAPLELAGADSPIDSGYEDGYTVVGFYVLVYPGQTRSITLRYRPQVTTSDGTYKLVVQKQAGTLARPLTLSVRAPGAEPLVLQSDLWRDGEFRVEQTAQGLSLTTPLPALHPTNTPEQLAMQGQWAKGWQLWQAGNPAAALEHWQNTATLDPALDQVVALRWQGQLAAAQQLLDSLAPLLSANGRAAFLAGQLAEARGDAATAQAAYAQAIILAPDRQIARLALALLQQQQGNAQAAIATLRAMRDPVQALRRVEFDQRSAGFFSAAEETNKLILELMPEDITAWEQRYWMVRFGATPPLQWGRIITLTSDALNILQNDAVWLSRRAEAYQWTNQPQLALADWQQTTVLSPSNDAAWYAVGLLKQTLGDSVGAVAAFEQAINVTRQPPVESWLRIAEIYEQQQAYDKARQAYHVALQMAPNHEGIRQALLRLGGQ